MKKVICYAIGLLFAFFSGMTYMAALVTTASRFPLKENKLMTSAVFYILLPIVFVLFLTRYNFAAANSFGKMRYAPLFLILGLISAVIGGVMVLKGILPEISWNLIVLILFVTTFVTYKLGRLIAKNYKKANDKEISK